MAKELVVKVIGDTSQFERALKQTESKTDKFKRNMAKAGKVAGAGLLALGGGAIAATKAASDLGEELSKSEAIFGDSSKAIQDWSKTTAKSFGISQVEALEATGTFGNILVPMGLARDEAAKMSKAMVELAGDVASFNNASPEEVLQAMRSGLVGEAEPLRKFGVGIDAARIKSTAFTLGIAEQGEELTRAQKTQAIYAIMLEDTADAQGDSAKTADQLAGRTRRVQAQMKDLATNLGIALVPVFEKLADVLSRVIDWMSKNQKTIQILIPVLAGLAAGIVAINAALFVLSANPIVLVAAAIIGLGAGLVIAYKQSEKFRKIVNDAFDAVKKVADKVWPAVRDHVELFWKFLKRTFENVKRVLGGIVDFIAGVFSGDWDRAWDGIKNIFGGMWDQMKNIVSTTIESWKLIVTNLGSKLWNALKGGWEVFRSGFEFLWTVAKNFVRESIVNPIVGFFGGLPGKAWNMLKGAWSTLREGFGNVFGGLKKMALDTIDDIVDFFAGLPEKIKDVIVAGFKKVGNAIWDAVKAPFLGPFGGGEGVNPMEEARLALEAKIAKSIPAPGTPIPGVTGSNNFSPNLQEAFAVGTALGLSPTTYPSHHPGPDRAIDWFGPESQLAKFAQWAVGRKGIQQLIYTPWGIWTTTRASEGVRPVTGTSVTGRSLAEGHKDHLHMGTFDKGGFLMPGLTLARNDTGVPERVLAPGQSAGMVVNVTVHGSVQTERDLAVSIRDELVRLQRRNGTTGIV